MTCVCNLHAMQCYEYMDVPPEQQLSDPPEAGSTKVVWRQGVRNVRWRAWAVWEDG